MPFTKSKPKGFLTPSEYATKVGITKCRVKKLIKLGKISDVIQVKFGTLWYWLIHEGAKRLSQELPIYDFECIICGSPFRNTYELSKYCDDWCKNIARLKTWINEKIIKGDDT